MNAVSVLEAAYLKVIVIVLGIYRINVVIVMVIGAYLKIVMNGIVQIPVMEINHIVMVGIVIIVTVVVM